MKKKFTAQQKATVALTAIKGDKSAHAISSLFSVHPTQVNTWKRFVEEHLATLFADKRTKEGKTNERLIRELYQLIGQRDVELEWMKKNLQLFDT